MRNPPEGGPSSGLSQRELNKVVGSKTRRLSERRDPDISPDLASRKWETGPLNEKPRPMGTSKGGVSQSESQRSLGETHWEFTIRFTGNNPYICNLLFRPNGLSSPSWVHSEKTRPEGKRNLRDGCAKGWLFAALVSKTAAPGCYDRSRRLQYNPERPGTIAALAIWSIM